MAHGSFFNMMMSNGKSTPEVGMGATLLLWTDRHAGTITEVSEDKKTIKWKADKVSRVDNNGMSDSQDYSYEPNPDAKAMTFTLRKNGKYVVKGAPMKQGMVLSVGHRSEYYDYTF